MTEFRRFFEDKDRLINRLWLTGDQKDKLKLFFKMHPNWENKIDWNNRDLKWEDFQDVLALEGTSKSSKKKYGLSGKAKIEDLVLGQDYKVVFENDHCVIYYPLNFKASEVLAKPTTPPVGVQGKWCIAGKNYSPGTRDQHWNSYTDQDIDFFFIFTKDQYLMSDKEKEGIESGKLGFLLDYYDSNPLAQLGFKPNSKFALARRSPLSWQIFDNTDTCIFNRSPQNLAELYPNLKEIVEAIDKWPNELKALKYWTDPYSQAVYSNDKTRLCKVNTAFPNGLMVPKKLYVLEGTKGIDKKAFQNSDYFTEVYLPDSLTYIDRQAFYGAHIGTLYIGPNVDSISDDAFIYFEGNIVFTGNRTNIPPLAFGASSVTEVYMPDTVKSIGYEAFSDTETLKIVKFSKNLKEIGAGAFHHGKLLAFDLPDTVEKIETGAFRQNLFTHVTLPPKIKEIYPRTFSGCPNLKSVTINDGCTKIDHGAFANCVRLNAITIPASVTEIGNRAFYDCPLRTIYYKGTKEQWEELLRNCDPDLSKDEMYAGPAWKKPEEKVAFI